MLRETNQLLAFNSSFTVTGHEAQGCLCISYNFMKCSFKKSVLIVNDMLPALFFYVTDALQFSFCHLRNYFPCQISIAILWKQHSVTFLYDQANENFIYSYSIIHSVKYVWN